MNVKREVHDEVELFPLGAPQGRYSIVLAYSDGFVEIETPLYVPS